MTHGKSIRLFLADGAPTGIITAEIVNWTGHVLSAPRAKLSSLLKREECRKTGIYFLVSENLEPPFYPNVYIGESDDVAKRLEQHNRENAKGGKDFWEKVCLITSKDQNLTKAHIRYLEKQLIEMAKISGRCQLHNGTEGFMNILLPEADVSAMEYFLEQILVLLPVLGYDFLAKKREQILDVDSKKDGPLYTIEKKDTVYAKAIEEDGAFIVLKGSRVSSEITTGSQGKGYLRDLRPYLFETGIINSETYEFTEDYQFKSPSAAATIVLGRAANGRTEWRELNTNRTYAQVQEANVEETLKNNQ